MDLCLTCSASISADGRSSIPNHSEKPDPPPHFHPCGHVVCPACVRRNRRLVISCILCETAGDVLGKGVSKPHASSSRKDIALNCQDRLPVYQEVAIGVDETGNFVIGEEEDEDTLESNEKLNEAKEAMNVWREGENLPAYDDDEAVPLPAIANDVKREQCSVHYLRPEETLSGLALRYRVDGFLLCKLNKLPVATLTTTPHLLHTRPFILLPPNAHSLSTEPIRSPSAERRRLILHRFQLHTRCADWSTANAYITQVYDAREKESECVRQAKIRREEDPGETALREGGELEEAVTSWERDMKWEAEQANTKGKGCLGSKMRTTGQIEANVKGWSWR